MLSFQDYGIRVVGIVEIRELHLYLSGMPPFKIFSTFRFAFARLERSGVKFRPGIVLNAPFVSVTGSSFFFGSISCALIVFIQSI